MNPVNAAHKALGTAPARLDTRGGNNPGATAFYNDVPMTNLPPSCKVTPTESGFNLEGAMDDYAFAGQAFEGSTPGQFRKVILSFVERPQPQVLH